MATNVKYAEACEEYQRARQAFHELVKRHARELSEAQTKMETAYSAMTNAGASENWT